MKRQWLWATVCPLLFLAEPSTALDNPPALDATVADLRALGDRGAPSVVSLAATVADLRGGAGASPEMPVETPVEAGGAVSEELAAMRRELSQLQETLNFMVNSLMADLEAENFRLRDEVRRLYARGQAAGHPDPLAVPTPNTDLLEAVIEEAEPEPADYGEPEPAAPPPPPVFGHKIVKEWGRSPELANEIGGVASLKGMICLVPPGSLREDIEALGRPLRAEHAHHDNLNIEIFDDPQAAEEYAERHVSDPKHRVMSVSKHAASGRDVILFLHDGKATEVPATAE